MGFGCSYILPSYGKYVYDYKYIWPILVIYQWVYFFVNLEIDNQRLNIIDILLVSNWLNVIVSTFARHCSSHILPISSSDNKWHKYSWHIIDLDFIWCYEFTTINSLPIKFNNNSNNQIQDSSWLSATSIEIFQLL